MDKLISACDVLRQIEYASEIANNIQLERSARAVREAAADLCFWYESMNAIETKHVNPKRTADFAHYGIIYLSKLNAAWFKFSPLIAKCNHTPRFEIVIDCLRNTTWIEDMIRPYIHPTDVRAFGDISTMYTLDPESDVVRVGSLDTIEMQAACNCEDNVRIYEVECRTHEFQIEGAHFLISKGDVIKSKRYR